MTTPLEVAIKSKEKNPDGTWKVTLGSQAPFAIGDEVYFTADGWMIRKAKEEAP